MRQAIGEADAASASGAAIMPGSPSRKTTVMEPEHVNAIGNTLEGLKERTRELRRYL
jgi:hypothetical protein